MINETKVNVVVADNDIHPLIDARFGDGISLIDAKNWLAGIHQVTSGGHLKASDYPIYDVLAVAALEGSILEKELQDMAIKLHLPFRSFELPVEVEVGNWVVEVAMSRVREASVDAAESRRAAAILRQDLDRQHQAFHALEEAIQDFGMPQFTLALDLPLTVECMVFCGENCSPEALKVLVDAVGHLHQRLPVSARRISAIEFHIERLADVHLDSHLELSIRDLRGNILTTPVSICLSDLTTGWNRINLPEAIDCTDRDAILYLLFIGSGALALSLTHSIPIERFHPSRQDATPIGDSPLALKVWRGLIGVRPQISPLKVNRDGFIRSRSGELPMARLYSTDGDPMGFDIIQYWPKEDAFLVHPPSNGMTVAIIEGLELKNLISASAIVNNGHRESPAISFALGIVASGQFFHIPDVLGSWLTLPPLGWGEVHVALPESRSGKFDLVIATMVGRDQGNHMAWGLFRGFLLNAEAV